ncbi:MAG: glycosyltransferase family 2 protein [Pirellulaceae bacterium]
MSSIESEPDLQLSSLQAKQFEPSAHGRCLSSLRDFCDPADFKLTVVIPVYNEVNTVIAVIARVRQTMLPLEIIVVDDGSQDGTREKLATLVPGDDLRIILHTENRGKGAALRTGFELATGTAIVVQDADLNTTQMISVF